MKKRILLVEDEQSVLQMTKLRLEHAGFEVTVSVDGEEALGCVISEPPDLILLDVKLPKLDGFEVCKRLKENPMTAKIPIVIFTASAISLKNLTDRCIELGVADWIRKPFRSHELMEKIYTVLGERKEAA